MVFHLEAVGREGRGVGIERVVDILERSRLWGIDGLLSLVICRRFEWDRVSRQFSRGLLDDVLRIDFQ